MMEKGARPRAALALELSRRTTRPPSAKLFPPRLTHTRASAHTQTHTQHTYASRAHAYHSPGTSVAAAAAAKQKTQRAPFFALFSSPTVPPPKDKMNPAPQKQQRQQQGQAPPPSEGAVEGAPETCDGSMPARPVPPPPTAQPPAPDPSSCCFPHVEKNAATSVPRVKGDDGYAGTCGHGYGAGE